nr:MAG TPA: hypothetical protein [Caudoviricetes sp.]
MKNYLIKVLKYYLLMITKYLNLKKHMILTTHLSMKR